MLRSTIFLQKHLYQIFAPVTKGLFFLFPMSALFLPCETPEIQTFLPYFFRHKIQGFQEYSLPLYLFLSSDADADNIHASENCCFPAADLSAREFLSPMAECELHLLSFHPAPAENVYNVLWHDSIWYPFPARSPDICFLFLHF